MIFKASHILPLLLMLSATSLAQSTDTINSGTTTSPRVLPLHLPPVPTEQPVKNGAANNGPAPVVAQPIPSGAPNTPPPAIQIVQNAPAEVAPPTTQPISSAPSNPMQQPLRSMEEMAQAIAELKRENDSLQKRLNNLNMQMAFLRNSFQQSTTQLLKRLDALQSTQPAALDQTQPTVMLSTAPASPTPSDNLLTSDMPSPESVQPPPKADVNVVPPTDSSLDMLSTATGSDPVEQLEITPQSVSPSSDPASTTTVTVTEPPATQNQPVAIPAEEIMVSEDDLRIQPEHLNAATPNASTSSAPSSTQENLLPEEIQTTSSTPVEEPALPAVPTTEAKPLDIPIATAPEDQIAAPTQQERNLSAATPSTETPIKAVDTSQPSNASSTANAPTTSAKIEQDSSLILNLGIGLAGFGFLLLIFLIATRSKKPKTQPEKVEPQPIAETNQDEIDLDYKYDDEKINEFEDIHFQDLTVAEEDTTTLLPLVDTTKPAPEIKTEATVRFLDKNEDEDEYEEDYDEDDEDEDFLREYRDEQNTPPTLETNLISTNLEEDESEQSFLIAEEELDTEDLDLFKENPIPTSVEVTHVPPKLPDYDFSEQIEDAATIRLDLARAYFEMKDFDSAEEILQSVIREGNTFQQKEAQTLIDKLNAARDDS